MAEGGAPTPRVAVAQGWGKSVPPKRAFDHAVAEWRIGHPAVILVVRFVERNVPRGCARLALVYQEGTR